MQYSEVQWRVLTTQGHILFYVFLRIYVADGWAISVLRYSTQNRSSAG